MSFTHLFPTCGCMPLPALSLWPGRQQCRPRLVDGRRGGGPSYVAPRCRNPPTERRRDIPISSSLFSHGPPLCTVGHKLTARQQSQSSPDPGKDSATSNPILTEGDTSVMLPFQSCSLLLLADESSYATVRMKLFRDFNLLAAGW